MYEEQLMTAEYTPPLSREKLVEEIEKITTPIDFDLLIKDQVLEKVGTWYRIKDEGRLPDYAKAQIQTLKSGGLVKFSKPSKTLEKLAQKLPSKRPIK